MVKTRPSQLVVLSVMLNRACVVVAFVVIFLCKNLKIVFSKYS